MSTRPEPADRCVICDDGDGAIVVTVYSADQRAAVATVSPAVAIYLAGRLIAAALPKLREAGHDRGR